MTMGIPAAMVARAARIFDLYSREFPEQLDPRKVKRIVPFIY
jgi:hypothetical protein